MGLKANILRIFSANFLTMISSILIGFIVPAILTVESYSLVKTYTFYVSYIGFLHFGFIDGMYIKYGGKDISEINKLEFKNEHYTFLVFQVIVMILFLVNALITQDTILILMSVSILPINVYSFHNLFYQATGQFSIAAKVSYLYTAFNLLLNIFIALIMRSKSYIPYCMVILIVNGIVALWLEYKFFKNFNDIKGKFSIKCFNHIKVGIFILIGNLSVILFYAIDRWFIKLFFTSEDFGYYSFAISMLNIINILISAIAVTFYNYLSKGEDIKKIKEIKDKFIILGAFAGLGYFAFAGIVSLFLKKYEPALSIIAISFAAYPYMIIINTLYVNLYKARKDEKKYVKVVFFMVFIATIYNIALLLILKKPEMIAVGTTLSFITWYLYSVKDFDYLKPSLHEAIYLIVTFVLFLYCSHKFDWILGGMLYLILVCVMTIIFYKKNIVNVLNLILTLAQRKA